MDFDLQVLYLSYNIQKSFNSYYDRAKKGAKGRQKKGFAFV